jgi:hypothetical protein
MGAVVAAAAVLISVGAISGSLTGFAAIAVGYGLMHNAIMVSEARLQSVIIGPARATVTSVAGLSSEVVALAVYAMFAVGTGWLAVATLVAVLGIPTVGVAAAVTRSLPAICGKLVEGDALDPAGFPQIAEGSAQEYRSHRPPGVE